MVEKVLQLHIDREKQIFWTLFGILIISIGFYMYFINVTIHNVVARQNLESEISQLTLSTGKEEFQYISKRNAVTIQLAYSMGFKDVSNKTFISETPNTKVAFLSH